jgi:glucuronate isomerase
MKPFLDDSFLLQSEPAQRLYHEYAAQMPIFDYHCHLPSELIATDHRFENLTQIWLAGDHYKWRAMRTNGVAERLITGDASDREKFQAWAETVPATVGNPLFHWTHLELKKPFGIIGTLLNGDSAEGVWQEARSCLARPEFSTRGILRRMNVRLVCTTDDPVDGLESHASIAANPFETTVIPAFRPDKAVHIEQSEAFRTWLSRLETRVGRQIATFDGFLEAIAERFRFFHECGARISDHALEWVPFRTASASELGHVFARVREGGEASAAEAEAFQTQILRFLASLYASHGWVMQLHIAALRNNSSGRFAALGPDTGFDAISDRPFAANLSRLLDSMEASEDLPKTIVYTLNPNANEIVVALMGSFQDGSVAGKMQFGSGWWFNDQKDGMQRQMTALANLGLLPRFVGMLTDSRSFLSFPRHEYFRRVLCDLLGSQVAAGELPEDYALLGTVVRDICWNNAVRYFNIPGIDEVML